LTVRPPIRSEAGAVAEHLLGGRSTVAVLTLGGLSVYRGRPPGSPAAALDGPWLAQRPGDLLALLIAERERALAAEAIAEALWPGRDDAALGTVHHFVSVLRDRLEPARARGDAGAVETVGRGYRLSEAVVVDADRFAAHVASGLLAWREGNAEPAVRELAKADALYRGPFLGEREGPWVVQLERERLRALAADVWRALIELARGRGDADAAERHLARLAAHEPYDDDVRRRALALAPDDPAQRPQTQQSDISSPANGRQIDGA
jgi:DNA-binding SARP family transcriptional activator